MTPNQSTHAIEIRHDGKAFIYQTAEKGDGTTIRVRPGDHVKWSSHVGNYSILFKGESPFDEIAAHGRKGAETSVFKVNAKPGKYFYGVTLAMPDASMVVDDPVIIVGGSTDGGF
jgi:hypothetical protein